VLIGVHLGQQRLEAFNGFLHSSFPLL
jgi:hypothetical protein